MQGIQFIVDDSGGFSAVAVEFLENLVDDYTNTPVMLYAARGPGSSTRLRSRKHTISGDLHDAISFSRLSSYSKLIVPVGLPILSTIAGHRASVSEVKDMIHAAFERSNKRPMFCRLSAALCPLPIPLPFPSIFGNLVGQCGELISGQVTDASRKGSLDVHSKPMAARLRSNSAILPFLKTRLQNLRRFGIERGALGAQLLSSWGFGKEELVEMEEILSKMVVALSPQFSSDSD